MVITMSTPVKTSLKMFWTLWESSLSRLRPSQGTETLFTLCSTHQSLMCFLFVIKFKKKILPSSSCVTVHSPGFLFCGLTFSTPYLSLNVTAIPAPYAQSVLTQCAKGSCGGLEKYHLFCGLPLVSCMGLDSRGLHTHMSYHLRSYSHPPSLGPESSGPLQFVPKTC